MNTLTWQWYLITSNCTRYVKTSSRSTAPTTQISIESSLNTTHPWLQLCVLVGLSTIHSLSYSKSSFHTLSFTTWPHQWALSNQRRRTTKMAIQLLNLQSPHLKTQTCCYQSNRPRASGLQPILYSRDQSTKPRQSKCLNTSSRKTASIQWTGLHVLSALVLVADHLISSKEMKQDLAYWKALATQQ